MSRYNRVVLTVAALVVVPAAVYDGVALRDRFGTPTYHKAKFVEASSSFTTKSTDDRRIKIQEELSALLDERQEIQRKIDDVRTRIARR